jgi:hypothetical protein
MILNHFNDKLLHFIFSSRELLKMPKLKKQSDSQRREKINQSVQALRSDEGLRRSERIKDAERRRIDREDPDRREEEQAVNTTAHRKVRQDPEYRAPEKVRDAISHQLVRQDPDYRTPEKEKDARCRRITRANSARRKQDQEVDSQSKTKKRKIDKSSYSYLREQYDKKIRCGPSSICSCCGGLWYEESTSKTSEEILTAKGCSEEVIDTVLHVPQMQHRLCGTCKRSVVGNKIPRMCLSNGFDFPIIPEELEVSSRDLNVFLYSREFNILYLQDLSPLEERLVALRLPFMQIRLKGFERQSVLAGNVVNVENDLDRCAQALPRTFDDSSTIQVQLMRMMKYKVPYMYETIRPHKVYKAAKYLVDTELYAQENVGLSEDWMGYANGK